MKILTAILTTLALCPFGAFSKANKDQQTQTPTILEDPLLHLGFAWKDVSQWTEQADRDVKAELDKVDLGDTGKWLDQAGNDVGDWVKQAAKDVKTETDKIDLGDTGKWLDQVGKDIGGWITQAAKGMKAETDKIDMTGANEMIRGVAKDIQHAINNMDGSDFERWLKQASKDIGLNAALSDLQAIKLEELPTEAVKYIQENPGQTVFYVIEGVAIIAPGVVYGPLLGMLGFTAGGVKAGTAAAGLQRLFGGAVPAGSWFAGLTSAGAGGYGAGVLNGAVRVGGAVVGGVKAAVDQASNGKSTAEH